MNSQTTEPLAALAPEERRATGVIASVATLRLFALFALLPVMSLFAAGLEGATPVLVGLAVGGYGLTQALLQVPLGALSDRIGRVPVILLGLGVFALGSIVAALADDIHGVIVGRLLQGAGAVSATLTALLADRTRPEVRTRTMAILGVGVGASFLLALVAGPAIAAVFDVRALFWLAAVLAGVSALVLVALPEAPPALPAAAPRPPVRRSSLTAVLRPSLLGLDASIFVLHALLTATFVALPLLLEDTLALPVTAHWKVYTTALLLSLTGMVPLILADDRGSRRSTVTVAVALLASGQLLLAFGGFSTVAVVAALALFFAGFGFLEAGLPARLSVLAPPELRGTALGVFTSAQFLGIFAGGLAGGRLLAGGRPADVFLAGAVVAALWLVLHRVADA
ncbi:MAG TPA: MFS transporter [Woeseiaceae bacterium]|nr:MFS transporter [Woeseiaceae bacterium]